MRLVYFSSGFNGHDRRLSKSFIDCGYEVSLLCLGNPQITEEDHGLFSSVHCLNIKPEPEDFSGYRVERLVEMLPLARKKLEALSPEHVIAGPLHQSAFLCSLIRGLEYTAISWAFDILYLSDTSRDYLKWITSALEKAKNFIFDCETTYLRCKELNDKICENNSVIAPWGVDISHFKPESQPKAKNHVYTIFSNRKWDDLYCVKSVVNAFHSALKEKDDLRLVLAGNGPLEKDIKEYIKKHDLDEFIHLPGYVSYSESPRFYRSADLYLSFSLCDGSSVSLLEALACGLPVIVTDLPSNREWVESGQNGLLAAPRSESQLAAKILAMAELDKDAASEMSCRNRQLAVQYADWEKNKGIIPGVLTS